MPGRRDFKSYLSLRVCTILIQLPFIVEAGPTGTQMGICVPTTDLNQIDT